MCANSNINNNNIIIDSNTVVKINDVYVLVLYI